MQWICAKLRVEERMPILIPSTSCQKRIGRLEPATPFLWFTGFVYTQKLYNPTWFTITHQRERTSPTMLWLMSTFIMRSKFAYLHNYYPAVSSKYRRRNYKIIYRRCTVVNYMQFNDWHASRFGRPLMNDSRWYNICDVHTYICSYVHMYERKNARIVFGSSDCNIWHIHDFLHVFTNNH